MFVNTIKWKDVLIVLLILGVTFGYFLDKKMLESSRGAIEFYEIASLVYFSKMKLLIIMFCLIWYFTCKHWWKSCILVIITIELLKFISIFNTNQEHFDKIEYYTSLPITLPIIVLLFFISKKMNQYNLAKEIRIDLDNEIDTLFFKLHEEKKHELDQLNNKLQLIKKEQSKVNYAEYLKNLILIRDEFYNV